MVIVSHLIEQMYDVVEGLNADIDRLVGERDRVNAAILALSPNGAPVVPADPKPSPIQRALRPTPAPKVKPIVKPAAKASPKPPVERKPIDWPTVARVYLAAKAANRRPIPELVDQFDVLESTARNWPGKCRSIGLLNATLDGPGPELDAPTALLPADIRHEVEPIPADRQVHIEEHTVEPIIDQGAFASRPTHVEHVVETERNGWRPGMAAELEEAGRGLAG